MSALLDARRYSQLKRAGLVVDGDPLDVIDSLLQHFVRYGTPNKLIEENQKLRQALVEAESRVSDAVGRALVLSKQNDQLQVLLRVEREPTRTIPTPNRMSDPRGTTTKLDAGAVTRNSRRPTSRRP